MNELRFIAGLLIVNDKIILRTRNLIFTEPLNGKMRAYWKKDNPTNLNCPRGFRDADVSFIFDFDASGNEFILSLLINNKIKELNKEVK